MRSALAAVAVAAALGAAGCGEAERTATPVKVTPVPTTEAPVPTTAAEIHEPSPTPEPTVAPTATASPQDTGGAEAGEGPAETGGARPGDEEGIGVPVEVTVREDRIVAHPETVPAFLPLRFTVRNRLDRDLAIVVMQAGDGDVVARLDVPGGGSATTDAEPLRPGTAEILSPDLDPDQTAILTVRPGG